MKLTVIGSGDAFGSGGRLQTCFHVATGQSEFLIDCGATALIGFHGMGLDPDRVDAIFISHLHGDHFAGLVWWLLHAEHVSHRNRSLTIAGPPGIEQRYKLAAEALFAGSTSRTPRYPITWHELSERRPLTVGDVEVTAYGVRHPSGAPSYALRFASAGRIIGFSGDTEWVDELVEVAAAADLYISECYGYEEPARYHMTWGVIAENLARLSAQRIMLTHMSTAMLRHAHEIESHRVVVGHDGLVIAF